MYTEEEYKFLEDTIPECRSKIVVLKDKIKLAEEGMCPTCGQEYKVDVETLKGDYVVLQDVLSTRIAMKKNYDDDKKRYDNEQADLLDNKSRVETYKQKKEMLETSLHPVVNEPEKLAKSSVYVTTLLEGMDDDKERLQNIISYNTDIINKNNLSNQKITLLQFQITELKVGDKPEEVASVENEFTLKAELKKCEESIILYTGAKAEYERVVKFNEGIRKEKDESAEVIQDKFDKKFELHRQFTLLSSSKDILNNDFSSYLIARGARFIQEKMNMFFQRVYGKYHITFEQDKNSIDFFYSDGDSKLTPCTLASGFEQALLSIGNRIALCALNNLGIFIADEIDSMASADKSVALMSNLINEKQFNQIWLITHCEETKEMLDNLADTKVYEVKNGSIA
jgi:hypothetical protein